MRSSEDIINHFTDEDGFVDLEACIKKFQRGLDGKFGQMTAQDFLALQEAHTQWALVYLANLVLDIGIELGALPKGKDVELHNLKQALAFDKTKRLYDLVHARRESKLHVPGRE